MRRILVAAACVALVGSAWPPGGAAGPGPAVRDCKDVALSALAEFQGVVAADSTGYRVCWDPDHDP